MEGETRVSDTVGGGESNQSSYWLDACEDILIDEFVNFDTSVVQDSVDNTSNQDSLSNDFFGGIDHILDSIKNGSGLPNSNGNLLKNGSEDSTGGENHQAEGLILLSNNGSDKDGVDRKRKLENCENVNGYLVNGKAGGRLSDHFTKENGVHRDNGNNDRS